MARANIAVIGANKSRRGIGPYVARSILNYISGDGDEVKLYAVTASSEENASQIRNNLDKLDISLPEDTKISVVDGEGNGLDNILPDVDAVVICTDHKSHYEYAKAALEAGKHVLVEKPLVDPSSGAAESIDQVVELLELARKNNLHIESNTSRHVTLNYILNESGLYTSPLIIDPKKMGITIEGKGKTSSYNLARDLGPHATALVCNLSGDIGEVSRISTWLQDNTVRSSFYYKPGNEENPYEVSILLMKDADKEVTEQTIKLGRRTFNVEGKETEDGLFKMFIHEGDYQSSPFPDITDAHVGGFIDTLLNKKSDFFIPPHKVLEGFVLNLYMAGMLHTDEANQYMEKAKKLMHT